MSTVIEPISFTTKSGVIIQLTTTPNDDQNTYHLEIQDLDLDMVRVDFYCRITAMKAFKALMGAK